MCSATLLKKRPLDPIGIALIPNFKWKKAMHFTLFFAIITLYLYHKESILEKLEDLREFWDPDTVDLMEWINQNTPKTAAFATFADAKTTARFCCCLV